VKEETVPFLKKKKGFLHPLSSSGKQSCTHSFGGHFKKDATSMLISPGTNSSVLLKNLPRMPKNLPGIKAVLDSVSKGIVLCSG